MTPCWRLLVCIFPFMAIASEYSNEMERADSYWEANDIDKARSIYQELLQRPLDASQKQKLLYNIASADVKQGKYQSAIATLSSIMPIESPWIGANIFYNLSAAHIGRAYQLLEEDPSTFKEPLYHFEMALQALNRSVAARCEIEVFVDNRPCAIPQQMKAWQSAIEKEIAWLKNQPKASFEDIGNVPTAGRAIVKQLQHMVAMYNTAVDIGFNPYFFSALQQEYRVLQDIAKHGSKEEKKILQAVQSLINSSEGVFKSSIESFKASETLGILLLKYASIWLQEATYKFSSSSAPPKLLEMIIDAQALSLEFSKAKEEGYVKEAQALALANAETFIPAVYEEQKALYSQTGACQSSPWEIAFPLFEEGKKYASIALKRMNGKETLPYVIAAQQRALEAWRKAAFEIDHPSPSEGCRSQNQSKDKVQANVQSSLQLLQEMQIDDRIPNPPPQAIEISKPW
jgi:hypothetical protein